MPHQSVDPIYIGSQIVSALQSLVSRNTNPTDPAVVSVTQFHSGSAYNVIPESAQLCGTVRTFSHELRDELETSMKRVCNSVAQSLGGSAELSYDKGYPATINEPNATKKVQNVANVIFGEENVIQSMPPTMGAEDFSYMLEKRPGCYMWLGQSGGPSSCMVHNPKYDFNDKCLPLGATLFSEIVERLMPLENK